MLAVTNHNHVGGVAAIRAAAIPHGIVVFPGFELSSQEGGFARIPREHMGSIDAKPVRRLVGELLEGGEEAFEKRRRKYGF